MKLGYVYILVNDAKEYKGLVKIGRTSQPLSTRARNLNTGATGDFRPVAFIRSARYKEIETMIHRIVKGIAPKKTVAANREFYKFTPDEAVEFLSVIAEGCDEQVRLVSDKAFICKWKGGEATGEIDELGCITVLAGSSVAEIAPRFTGAYLASRRRYEKCGIIRDGKFRKDITFNSLSEAASVVLGRQANGRKEWKAI